MAKPDTEATAMPREENKKQFS